MDKLLDYLRENFNEEDIWIRIVGADWVTDDLTLKLVLQFDDRDPELWEVACAGVAKESLCARGASGLVLSASSPMLKPLMEPHVPIMFSENAMLPEALLGTVCASCLEVLGATASISDFMNDGPGIDGLVRSKYGLLGRFPASLADRIIDALKGKSILVNALPGHLPGRWDGARHIEYRDLQVLQIGASYVIAQQFTAVRVQHADQ